MRGFLRTGSSAVLLLAMMFVGSLVLWVGVPLAWLYLGSKVQGATHSVGAAIAVMLPGTVITIFALIPILSWLNSAYAHGREARGLESYGQAPLEAVLVVSATIAIAGFGAWFFLFSGTPPLGGPR
ncbi:MAG: hypothetical protein QOJ07_3918 [Thermoleophilaceae bacterium]|jgi:hypothetical protein|nr:hypothetical protein [Thermoleophilaceae bacterium]